MRILTLNAHKGVTAIRRRPVLARLRDALRAVDADLVFVQEAVGPDGQSPGAPAQCAWLAEGAWPAVAFHVNAPNRLGPIGNGLLSKFPIETSENVTISGVHGERRGGLHCVVRTPHLGRVHAISVHLGLLARLRDEQATRLWAHVAARVPPDAPLVVAGDFNDWTRALDRHVQRPASVHDGFTTLHGVPARTFPALLPLLPLDRIYLRHLTPVRARALSERPWSSLTDHVPVLVDVRATGPAA